MSREQDEMKATQCNVAGCNKGGKIARGMCAMHYKRRQIAGTLEPIPSLTVAERLARGLVRQPNGCLEWQGAKKDSGYGEIAVNSRPVATHRLAWTLANGPIPDGMCVLHKCDNRPCCDVSHHFLGSRADNVADMVAKGRQKKPVATQCLRGHPYDEANTYFNPNNNKRQCRACGRAASMAFSKRKRDLQVKVST